MPSGNVSRKEKCLTPDPEEMQRRLLLAQKTYKNPEQIEEEKRETRLALLAILVGLTTFIVTAFKFWNFY